MNKTNPSVELQTQYMNYKKWIIRIMLLPSYLIFAQGEDTDTPKLVVGIVVDQMRFDQLYKYHDRYSEGGFKRLLKEGYNFKNMQYTHIPTVTAAGHASIYTGATPSVHGIIGNSWYDKNTNAEIDNVFDDAETLLGLDTANVAGASPKKLMVNTISDQIRLSTNFKSKVISISLKDRGAILPGGHTANGAYWYDWKNSPGHFVTSTYYHDTLPRWVAEFNQAKHPDVYLNKTWNTLYPISTYHSSISDNNIHERVLRGKKTPTFPYNFKALRKFYKERKAEYQLMWVSPGGNTMLSDLAFKAIEHEKLGTDKYTDLLNIGYSVPDIAGHTFGPQSVEIEDIYLRLDLELARLLTYLDQRIGKDQYLLFLTSDHAAISVASYLHNNRLPSGLARIPEYHKKLNQFLKQEYQSENLVAHFDGEQIYLNHEEISKLNIPSTKVVQNMANYLNTLNGIKAAIPTEKLENRNYSGQLAYVQKGVYRGRSGNIALVFDPGFIQTSNLEIKISEVQGTTHGSGYAYDTHVPMLWYGKSIPPGRSVRPTAIVDIAATLSMLLNLQLPNGNVGKPLYELFENEKK